VKVLVPAMCQQGQVYSQYWLSTIECLQKSHAHNNEAYRRIDAELASKIIQQIPGFDPLNVEHQKLLNESKNHPLNLKTFQAAYQRESIDIEFYAMSGESLLARGRNHAVQVALTRGCDKIFFIDADQGFSWNEFVTLMKSPYPVSAGVVPLKAYPVPGSFETSLNFLPFEEDEMFFDDSLRTLKSTLRMARAKKSRWLKVAFTGTGFLCVDISVFMKLAESCSEYVYPNPDTSQSEVHWSFFDGGPMEDRYFSEDWSFIGKARKAGFDCMVNVDVRPTHTGPHLFRAG
jgi:hypothetical protein